MKTQIIKVVIISIIMLSHTYAQVENNKEEDVTKWGFDLMFGLNYQQGNTDKIGGHSALKLDRVSSIDEFLFNANIFYSETHQKKDTHKGDMTLKYDYDFYKKESFFLFIIPSYNEFHNIKYRIQNGIGLKHTFLKNEYHNHSLSGAVLYEVKEYLHIKEKKEITRLSFRPKMKYLFNKENTLLLIFFYQPKIDQWEDYRMLLEFSIDFKIIKYLFFEFKILDEYNNIVIDNIERNDITIINGIKIKI